MEYQNPSMFSRVIVKRTSHMKLLAIIICTILLSPTRIVAQEHGDLDITRFVIDTTIQLQENALYEQFALSGDFHFLKIR